MNGIIDGGCYTLKDDEWLNNQRHAGKVLVETINEMGKLIAPGVPTKFINDLGEKMILSHDGCTPTFKGYNGFPEAFCISINKELVHGIPRDDRFIKDGDIVKIDGGVSYKGAIADMARTFAVGNADKRYLYLMDAAKSALSDAIASIKFDGGCENRIGTIGYIIKKAAIKIGAKVITELTGHGLELGTPHWFPFIYNIGEKNKGLRIYPRMTFCIEPMMAYGNNKITLGTDNWTVSTESAGVHFEDTIFIHEDHVEIITAAE